LECWNQQNSIWNRGLRCGVGTKGLLPRTDCGWQNQEREASNRSEHPRSLASNADCMGHAVPPQTSGMRGVLSRFTMFSLQLASDVLPKLEYRDCSGYAAVCLAIFVIGSGMRTRLGRPDAVSSTSTKTKLSPITIGSLRTSNCSPYNFIWFPGLKPNPFSLAERLSSCFFIYEYPCSSLTCVSIRRKEMRQLLTLDYSPPPNMVALCLRWLEPAVIECSGANKSGNESLIVP
jgi:hypothetical protein